MTYFSSSKINRNAVVYPEREMVKKCAGILSGCLERFEGYLVS